MLAHILAAEFTLSRPETPLGWIVLILVAVSVILIVSRGIKSFIDIFDGHVVSTVLALGAIALILFIQKVRVEQRDPLVEGEIDVFPVSGVHTETHPGHHGDGHTTYDTGN